MPQVKLQLALDGTLDAARAVLEAAHSYVDVIEIGTPLIFREGVAAVRWARAAYPGKAILADLKIMDAGEAEAAIAFEAGAGVVTVLGAAADATVCGAVRAARQHGGQIMFTRPQGVTGWLRGAGRTSARRADHGGPRTGERSGGTRAGAVGARLRPVVRAHRTRSTG